MNDETTAAETTEVVEETDAPSVESGDTATPTDAESQETQTETPEEKPKPRRNRRTESRRIAQLTAQLREKERALEALQNPPPPPPAAPKRDDFEDYEEYVKAVSAHEGRQAADQRIETAQKEREEAEKRAQIDRQIAARQEAHESLISNGMEKYADFEEVALQEDLPISEAMAAALLSNDKGDDVWYHLGKNPDVAAKIARISDPIQQAVEIGLLTAQLAGGKQASGVPPPTRPVNSRGTSNNALSDKLSTAEWMRKRNEEVRKNSF